MTIVRFELQSSVICVTVDPFFILQTFEKCRALCKNIITSSLCSIVFYLEKNVRILGLSRPRLLRVLQMLVRRQQSRKRNPWKVCSLQGFFKSWNEVVIACEIDIICRGSKHQENAAKHLAGIRKLSEWNAKEQDKIECYLAEADRAAKVVHF